MNRPGHIPGRSIFDDEEDVHDGLDPDEPIPVYWNMGAVGLALGIIVGFVLAWIPAGIIIWRLT
jgi:hypothetical protein